MSRVWLITGRAEGIGAGIPHAALKAGDQVMATDLDLGRLDDVFSQYGDQILTAQLDFRDENQPHAAINGSEASNAGLPKWLV